DCTPRPSVYGSVPDSDNASAFQQYQSFKDTALHAPTPNGWASVFINKTASSKGGSYISYLVLESYNTTDCAARCEQISECKAINIYFERTPTLYLGYECQDAPSMTVIKCAFWGEKLLAANVKNWGYRDWNFEVVMAGSNGYN
ncbi:hypothetical protein BKA66DRAFT_392497, partial [Pyrenochaeta sp. MPI-SDFR-AT-0127]